MWIFTNDAFISIVAHRDGSGRYMVRSRKKEDIERLFQVEPISTPDADYAWRIVATPDMVVPVLLAELKRVTYDNFKDSVDEKVRHDAYMGVWTAMFRFQNGFYDKKEPALPLPARAPQPYVFNVPARALSKRAKRRARRSLKKGQ